ncbi:hypothetical protein Hanom_Chr03g00262941 [Helianthus anomalus]
MVLCDWYHWRSLTPHFFPKPEGAKTYIPKKFYTKLLFITLRIKKFRGADAPSRPK